MRSLLTFTGSVVYLVVMTVIAPLLLLVYGGLQLVVFYRHLKPYKMFAWAAIRQIHFPTLHFPLRKQYLFLRDKAVRLHW